LAHAEEAGVAVTVYNNDLALVRQTRLIRLKKGIQQFKYTDVAAMIDSTTVHFASRTSPSGIELLEQNFEYDLVGTQRLLEKYLNQNIIASTKEGNAFSGTLLNAQGQDVIIQLKDGPIKVVKADFLETIEFPSLPEGLITQPTLVWLLDCRKPGQHMSEISYLTKGVKWHAEYVAVTNPKDTGLELGGWVSIENRSGTTYRDATLKLVAGDVHMARPIEPVRRMRAAEMAFKTAPPPQFEEKAFFEYHLYTLRRPSTLKDRQIKQITLFPSAKARAKKTYTYDGQKNDKKVGVFLEFINDKAGGLGLPLPAGKIRVYKQDLDGSQVFIGEDLIDHTPRDEKVRIYVGNVFDIVGERTLKDVQEISRRSRRETVEIRLRNHKEEDVRITVIEHFRGDWEFVGQTPPIKKKTAKKVEFETAVSKGSEKVLQYTVLYKR
jgi:hypothetical protein